jgi:hypothetical protein
MFKCSLWNSAKKACDSSWTETSANFDKIKNNAVLQSTSLSAFTIGNREKISVSAGLDKKTYNLKDLVKIRGRTLDSATNPIPNAVIDIKMGDTLIGNMNSDSNGVFNIEFISPGAEDNYTLTIYAKKEPYLQGEQGLLLEVVKLRSLSILFSDSIRISPGGEAKRDIVILNTGQDDFHGLRISIEGIPQEFYVLASETTDIPVNGQSKIGVSFAVPENAEQKTYAALVKVQSDTMTKDKSFGFTVASENNVTEISATQQENPITAFLTNLKLPTYNISTFSLIVFALISFSAAIALKKYRKRRSPESENMSVLFDIKNHLRSKRRK